MENDIVKIQGVCLPQPPLVACVNLRNAGHPPVVGRLVFLGKLLRGLVLVLCVGDDVEDGAGLEFLLVQAHGLQDILDDPLAVVGIIDREIAAEAQAQPLNIPAQNPDAGAVEGGGPNILCRRPAHPLQPLLELPCRLVGEGDGDHRPGRGGLHGAQTVGLPPVLRGGVVRESLQKCQLFFTGPGRQLLRIAAPAEGVHLPVAFGDDRPAGSSVPFCKLLRHMYATSLFPILVVPPLF